MFIFLFVLAVCVCAAGGVLPRSQRQKKEKADFARAHYNKYLLNRALRYWRSYVSTLKVRFFLVRLARWREADTSISDSAVTWNCVSPSVCAQIIHHCVCVHACTATPKYSAPACVCLQSKDLQRFARRHNTRAERYRRNITILATAFRKWRRYAHPRQVARCKLKAKRAYTCDCHAGPFVDDVPLSFSISPAPCWCTELALLRKVWTPFWEQVQKQHAIRAAVIERMRRLHSIRLEAYFRSRPRACLYLQRALALPVLPRARPHTLRYHVLPPDLPMYTSSAGAVLPACNWHATLQEMV